MNHCESCRYGGNCDKEWRYSKLTYPCEKYDKVQTNEEWLKGLNTEQLAEHLLNVWMDGAFNVNAEFGLNEAQIEKHKGYVMEWLKQPHQGGE